MSHEITLRFVPPGVREPGAHVCSMITAPIDVRIPVHDCGVAKCPYCGRKLTVEPPRTVIERYSRPSISP